jgi:hypothetical protein
MMRKRSLKKAENIPPPILLLVALRDTLGFLLPLHFRKWLLAEKIF